MHSIEDHKKQTEKMILECIAEALEKKQLDSTQTPAIADFVLSQIDTLTTHHQLVIFVTTLAQKWPIFKNLKDLEDGEERKTVESEGVKVVLELMRKGDFNNAHAYAKKLTYSEPRPPKTS